MSGPAGQVDVAIIGGGVIGCAIAWRLGQAGLRVAVIERGDVGEEATRAAGGMLAPLAEADEADEFFRLAVASRAMYAQFARDLRDASGIDVEYRTEGTLYLSLAEEDDPELDRRWRWQREAGLNVERLDHGCVLKLEPLLNQSLRWALKYPDDHQVNNRRLMAAVHLAAIKAGVEFRTQTEARRLLVESTGGRKRVRGLETTRGLIESGCLVIAAGSWSGLLGFAGDDSPPVLKVEPVRGQMVAVDMPTPPVDHVIYSRRGYLIPRLGGFLIAGSTTEMVGYDRRVTGGGLASIVAAAGEILPAFKGLAITETWAGLRPRTADEWPILGADPRIEGLVYATGHYRNGILLAPITAQALSELIITGESRIDLRPFCLKNRQD